MSKLPDKAQKNLSTFLAKLKKECVIHYCVVRPGATGKPLGIFAAKSTEATTAALKKVYGADEGLGAPEKDWVCGRGAIQVTKAEDALKISVIPASKDNDVKGENVLKLFRDLKKTLGERSGPAAMIEPLITAQIGEPVDTATLDPKHKAKDKDQGGEQGEPQDEPKDDAPEYDIGPAIERLEQLGVARQGVSDALRDHAVEQPRDQVGAYLLGLSQRMTACVDAKNLLVQAVEVMPEEEEVRADLLLEIEAAKEDIKRIGDAIYDVQVFEKTRDATEFLRDHPKPHTSGDLLKQIPRQLKQQPQLLMQLVEAGHQDVVDTLMEGYGKAKWINAEDRKVMKEAFRARFGIKEMSVGSAFTHIPKLYETMKLVPPSHTRGNNMLNALRYDFRAKASDYDEDKQKMTLHLTPSGRLLNIGMTSVLGDRSLPKKTRKVSFYKATTLHEIGHGFDASIPFMSVKGKQPEYGGWIKETTDSVAKVVANKKGLCDLMPLARATEFLSKILAREDVKDLKDAIAKDYGTAPPALQDCMDSPAVKRSVELAEAGEVAWGSPDTYNELSGSNQGIIRTNFALFQFIKSCISESVDRGLPLHELVPTMHKRASGPAPKIGDLMKHPAVAFCKKIMCDGDSGVWDKSDGGASAVEIDKRVYQESYKNQWWSYNIGARAKRVSNYQFRSPDEWFAEVYAAYYMKTLPDTHEDYTWLNELDK